MPQHSLSCCEHTHSITFIFYVPPRTATTHKCLYVPSTTMFCSKNELFYKFFLPCFTRISIGFNWNPFLISHFVVLVIVPVSPVGDRAAAEHAFTSMRRYARACRKKNCHQLRHVHRRKLVRYFDIFFLAVVGACLVGSALSTLH